MHGSLDGGALSNSQGYSRLRPYHDHFAPSSSSGIFTDGLNEDSTDTCSAKDSVSIVSRLEEKPQTNYPTFWVDASFVLDSSRSAHDSWHQSGKKRQTDSWRYWRGNGSRIMTKRSSFRHFPSLYQSALGTAA